MFEFCEHKFANLILINPETLVNSVILCDDYWLFSSLVCWKNKIRKHGILCISFEQIRYLYVKFLIC